MEELDLLFDDLHLVEEVFAYYTNSIIIAAGDQVISSNGFEMKTYILTIVILNVSLLILNILFLPVARKLKFTIERLGK